MTAQRSMVLGYDPTEQSRYALSVATGLATRFDAHLHAVHIVDLRDYSIDPAWGPSGRARSPDR